MSDRAGRWRGAEAVELAGDTGAPSTGGAEETCMESGRVVRMGRLSDPAALARDARGCDAVGWMLDRGGRISDVAVVDVDDVDWVLDLEDRFSVSDGAVAVSLLRS